MMERIKSLLNAIGIGYVTQIFEKDEELSDKEEAHRAQCYLIEYAHAFGFLPFRFDLRKSWVEDVTSKWGLLYWKTSVTISVLFKVALLVKMGLDYHNDQLDFSSANGMLKTFFTVLMVFSTLLHLMTAIKRSDIPRLINSNHLYSDMYKERYDQNKGKMYQLLILNRVMKSFFFALVAFTYAMVPLYWTRCNFHLLSSILPMCQRVWNEELQQNQTVHTDFGGILFRLFNSWLQFLAATDLVGACFIYIAFAMPCIFVGLDIMNELTSMVETKKTNALLRTDYHWFLNYRCCYLLTTNVNACLSSLMPIVISSFVAVIVISNTVLLNTAGNIDILMTCIALNVFLLAFLFVAVGVGAKFCELSKTALVRRNGVISGEYYPRVLKGFAPIKVEVGSFQGLDKQSWPTVLAAIIDYTISFALAA